MFKDIPIQSSYSGEMADTIKRINKLKENPDLSDKIEENPNNEIYFALDGIGDLLFFSCHADKISSLETISEAMYNTEWSLWVLSIYNKKDDDGNEAYHDDAVETYDLVIWHIDKLREEEFINELEAHITILQF